MEEKSGFGYFLLGLGIGVAAGILWAPRSGEETRQLLADKAGDSADYLKARTDEGRQYVQQRASDTKDYVLDKTDSLKGAASDLYAKGKDSASDLYDKGRTTVAQQKENLTAAVEAGKQAYRDAVTDVKTGASNVTSAAAGSTDKL